MLKAIFWDQMRLTVKVQFAERTSKWDNGLHEPLMIER